MTIARVTEIIASSTVGFDDAVRNGIARANKSLKNVKGAWVESHKVDCDESGEIIEWRVVLKVTFILES